MPIAATSLTERDARELRLLIVARLRRRVDELLDDRRRIAEAVLDLDQPDRRDALDEDVELAVVVLFDHLDDLRRAAEFAGVAVVVGQHEAERLVVLEAAGGEIAVARLEHVQRGLLVRQQHHAEHEKRITVFAIRAIRSSVKHGGCDGSLL